MKNLVVVVLLLFIISDIYSQSRRENFIITIPKLKVQNSLYNTIRFIDSRYDNSNMGIVPEQGSNRKAIVISRISISTQLSDVVSALIDSTSKQAVLYFQLRELTFVAKPEFGKEKGYCFFKAVLYAKISNHYQRINSIDSIIFLKSIDVTRSLFSMVSKTITDFVAFNLLRSPIDSLYLSARDIVKVDSFEKSKIPLYALRELNDGLYVSYKTFMNQVPDKQIIVETDSVRILSAKIMNENGNTAIIKSKDAYAIVNKGIPYIVTDYGYFVLYKQGDDFFFTGKERIFASLGSVLFSPLLYAIGDLVKSGSGPDIIVRIEHSSGRFIKVKQVVE